MKQSTLERLSDFSILVVEDDKVARAMIKQGLKKYFKSFYEADDGLMGLEIFKKHKIDMILTDIHMPNLNGFEMIKYIQAIKPNQNFIIMTSYDNDENLLSSLKQGALNFLRKPLDIIELQTSLLLSLSKFITQKKQISKRILIDFKTEMVYLDEKAVFLSHKNHKIFWLLCYNLNNVVYYEIFEQYLYDEFSIKALQMSILRIKKELPSLMLENIQNIGYILKTI